MTPRGAGGLAKEGEIMSVCERDLGEGPGVFLEGNQEGISTRDFKGGGGGGGFLWGRVM